MKSEPKSDDKPAARPSGKVFDVQRPGKAPAAPTSRPGIVGHKPTAQKAQASVSGVGDSRPLLSHRRKIELLPAGPAEPTQTDEKTDEKPEKILVIPSTEPHVTPGEVEALATTALATTTTAPEMPKKPTEPQPPAPPQPAPPAKPDPEPKPEPKPQPTPEPQPQPKTEPELPELEQPPQFQPFTMDQPAQPAATDSKQAEQAAQPQDGDNTTTDFEPQDLIVVSHHRSPVSAWQVMAIIVLVALIGVVILDLLLDAGILTLPGIPHTNFFQQ